MKCRNIKRFTTTIAFYIQYCYIYDRNGKWKWWTFQIRETEHCLFLYKLDYKLL